MKSGIAIPISATRHLPGWALGLSLATHLVLLFGPALQRQTAASDLPPLAVSFRLPAMLAPAVAASAPIVARTLPAMPVAAAAARTALVPPARKVVLAVAASATNATSAPAVAAAEASPPSSPVSAETAPPAGTVVAPPAAPTADPEAMARYVRLLGDLLAEQQQYPRLAAARGWEGEVRLRLRLARKGTLIAVHIVHSSGFDVLDQHAVQLVQGTLLPPPPATGLLRDASPDLLIDIPIHYALKRS